jgi:DNA-binding IclR family transcriptional regulator
MQWDVAQAAARGVLDRQVEVHQERVPSGVGETARDGGADAAGGAGDQLAILDGADVVYVEVIAGHDRVATPSRRGGRMPAHCAALGKVLLAFTGADEGAAAGPLSRRTRHTIIDPAALRRALIETRREGIAFDDEESRLGLRCVAAPIFGDGGRIVAAMSVSLSTHDRLTPRQVEPAVRVAALGMRRVLVQLGVGAA